MSLGTRERRGRRGPVPEIGRSVDRLPGGWAAMSGTMGGRMGPAPRGPASRGCSAMSGDGGGEWAALGAADGRAWPMPGGRWALGYTALRLSQAPYRCDQSIMERNTM